MAARSKASMPPSWKSLKSVAVVGVAFSVLLILDPDGLWLSIQRILNLPAGDSWTETVPNSNGRLRSQKAKAGFRHSNFMERPLPR